MQPSFSSLLWFAAVVALIPVALWLLKRTPLAGQGHGRAGTAHAVAVLPLSAQQKVVTVEVGQGDARTWLVLGVSPHGIHTLHTMPALPEDPGTAPQPPNAAFAQLLGRLRSDKPAGPGRDAH